jgi:dephospho-CoA kinase
MKAVGLTGGVGMGKSTCADLLRARGIPVVDTDDLARQVVEPGQPALAEIRQAFGAPLIDASGHLRRADMARLAFSDSAIRKQLEGILHPRIRDLWRAAVGKWSGEGHRLGIVVIPLLFETQAEKELQATICVGCSAATQQSRLRSRGWSGPQAHQRISAQLPTEQKMARAEFVIWTEGSLEVHAAQLDRILDSLRGS